VERDMPKKSESVGQTLPVAMEIKKKGGFTFFRKDGKMEGRRMDGSVTISLCNFVGKGIISRIAIAKQ
jgi:hypothetical protein